MCVVIQNVVLGGGERDPTRAEGGTVRRPVAAAGLPPGPCARLAPSLVLLSPVESYRPPPAAFALGTQEEEEEEEEDVHPTQDHQPPDHVQCGVVSGAQLKKNVTESCQVPLCYFISGASTSQVGGGTCLDGLLA